jgi:two-component system sensor histidine kinase KdpD
MADKTVQSEATGRKPKGKLTVFLGAAAGVGKTRAMLDAARQRLAEQADVVVGWVETHGQTETEQLLAGLPQITGKEITYQGAIGTEMDVDAIIRRRPELVLIDELAHINFPGSRHLRRYQDVEEIIQAGINVYTTLNVQNIESLNDIVAEITGTVVDETVPDEIIEAADTVQLIDVPPEELLKRLREGKVHVPSQAEQAIRKFLRPGNISALRELSLRFTASHVDKDLAEYMREHHISGPWPAAGRVMVCISASPFSPQLIRTARRLAGGLQAELLAVHVEAPTRRFPLGDAERDQVARHLRLAEELGAKTLTVVGREVATEILELARAHNVNTIVVGKPRRGWLWKLFHGSLADELVRGSGAINVYFIQGTEQEELAALPAVKPVTTFPWRYYLRSLAMVAAVTIGSLAFEDMFEIANVALLYQLPVVLSAFWWGRWPSYFTAFCGVLCFDFLFIPPIYTFSVGDPRHLWSFLTFLIVAFLIGGRTEMMHLESAAASMRERGIRALYEFSRQIAAVIDPHAIVQKLSQHATETLDRAVVVLLPDATGNLSVWAGQPEWLSSAKEKAVDEEAVAAWVYDHGRPAGRSTDTSANSDYLFVPLKGREDVLGVLGIRIVHKLLRPEEKRLIDAWAGLAALAIERAKLAEKARQAALLEASDRLRTALFNSISHELRTPLASIIGSASTLLEANSLYTEAVKRELLENVLDGAARMERLVSNLLDTARLESGMMRPKIDWCDAEDVIGAALARLKDATRHHPINIAVDAGLPLMRADFVLIEQVLANLVDNAVKYSPRGSEIFITAERCDAGVEISVKDGGPGIKPEDLPWIFDKFYRGQHPETIGGTGLGLAICKGIIDAHGGQIWAENVPAGGVAFHFTLPTDDDTEPKNGGDNDE